jgi:hypothetical protein
MGLVKYVRMIGPDPGTDPSKWRAYNGQSFDVQFINTILLPLL